MIRSETRNREGEWRWETDIHLITNRDVVLGLGRLFGLTLIILGGLMTLIFATQGEWDSLAPMWLMLAAVVGGLALLTAAVTVVVFRNRFPVRYTVSERGVVFEMLSTTARRANRLAVVAGILFGRPGAAGAGLIAMSREQVSARWSGSFTASFDDAAHTIVLANRWRRLMIVQCTPENYEPVARFVRDQMARHRTDSRLAARSPLPRYLGWTAAVVGACIPVFLLVEPFNVSLLLPLLLLCFGVATLWLVPLFGYVMIGTAVLVAGSVVGEALTLQDSMFRPGTRFAHWTVFSGDDWALLSVAGASLAFLCWFAVQALRGRIKAVLMADDEDMGG